uniref:Uncharacterized protein n=1 Tax=Megaviridae environmental sample TaxID=1737588 RepID=A0A5J6VNJ8_9VIRU|nr:MAG: hypothetical protein [Megaviridae environmental sample]
MDPNCKHLSIIKKLEQHISAKKQIELKSNKKEKTISSKKEYEFNVKKDNTQLVLKETLTAYIVLFFIDVVLYIPAVYFLCKRTDTGITFFSLSIQKKDISTIKSKCLKHVGIDSAQYKTFITYTENAIVVYIQLKSIEDYVDDSTNTLVSMSEIKENIKIEDVVIDPIIIDYFRFEGYYNLTKKSKKKSIILLPKIEYCYSDSETLPINKETGYIDVSKSKKKYTYRLRLCLSMKEHKQISDETKIDDINHTIYSMKDRLIIPSLRMCRLLSIKKMN